MDTAKTSQKQRGKPFQKGKSGNPTGRPKGSRNKATILCQNLLEGQAEELVNKAIALALAGDTQMLKACLERLVPPRKDRPVKVTLPAMESAEDAVSVVSKIIEAVGKGELTPNEGQALTGLVENYRKALETAELDQRIAVLEEAVQKEKK